MACDGGARAVEWLQHRTINHNINGHKNTSRITHTHLAMQRAMPEVSNCYLKAIGRAAGVVARSWHVVGGRHHNGTASTQPTASGALPPLTPAVLGETLWNATNCCCPRERGRSACRGRRASV